MRPDVVYKPDPVTGRWVPEPFGRARSDLLNFAGRAVVVCLALLIVVVLGAL